MAVRCKMIVKSKTETACGPDNGWLVLLEPVADGSPENKEFYKWTPAGKLELSILNGPAAAALEVGKYYFVDLTAAE
jgi:hypothetical protein